MNSREDPGRTAPIGALSQPPVTGGDVTSDTPAEAARTDGFLAEVPVPLEEPVPNRIGTYRIVRILGQGGMGSVYEAEQETTRRLVALKVIHPHLATPRYRRRFAEEIRTLGRFEHPGIARIHDAGAAPDDQGALRLFFAMELVKGLRIDEHSTLHNLGFTSLARLMALVCDAVHHAHQKGVIHCDLKPANILVAPDGSPRVLDFGVARIMEDEARDGSSLTAPGEHAAVIGTLAFASPEQAAGDRNGVDVLTDVYGLGAVLHALVSRTPPHAVTGLSLAVAAKRVCTEAPPRLRALRGDCPVDLETIVAKAMAPQRSDRYDSAAALAADLRRFAEGRPITARPVPWTEVARLWMRRNRLATNAIIGTALSLISAMVVVGWALLARDREAARVLAERHDHAISLRAIQGAQLPADRGGRSAAFVEHLLAEERPEFRGRVLAALPWPTHSQAGLSPSQLDAFDDDGYVVARLDGTRAWPAWARPRFDPNGSFEQRLGLPQQVKTLVATVAQINGEPGRELIRGLRVMDEHIHMGILEISELVQVIDASGALTARTGQIWSAGDFGDVVWDPKRHLLWVQANAGGLASYVPELAPWDSAGCPNSLQVPRVALAIDLRGRQDIRGVLPPLVGDREHPPVEPVWAFSTRPPAEMRAGAAAPDGVAAPVFQLQILSFEPSLTDGEGLGRLTLGIRHPQFPFDALLSVALDDRGRPRGGFQAGFTGDVETDKRAAEFASRLVPADEIISLDLTSFASATEEAEEILARAATPAAARDAARASSPRTAACVEAMCANWRWLVNTASELLHDESLVEHLGAPPAPDRVDSIAAALWRLDEAARIHASRCPGAGRHLCSCEWFIESERAFALCAAGEWASSLESADISIAIHARHPTFGSRDVLDHSIRAISLQALGRDAEARQALRAAEAPLEPGEPARTHQGGVDRVAEAVLARAEAFVGRGP